MQVPARPPLLVHGGGMPATIIAGGETTQVRPLQRLTADLKHLRQPGSRLT